MKFRYKVLASNIILLSVSIGLVGYFMIHRNFNLARDSQIQSAVMENNLLQSSVEYELLQVLNQDNYNIAKELADIGNRVADSIHSKDSSVYIMYADAYVFSSDDREKEISDSLYKKAKQGKKQYVIEKNAEKYNVYVIALDIVEDNNLFIINRYDISSAYTMMNNQINYFRVVLLLVVLAASVVMYFISRVLTAPLEKLNMVTDEISKGNYDSKVDIKSRDEIGLLANKFNDMSDAIGKHVDELNIMVKRREQFVADFTHEIKTPMTTIIGYADTLRSREVPREDEIKALSYIFSEGKRLEKMSTKLFELIYLNQNEIEKKPIQTENFGKELKEIVQPMLKQNGLNIKTDFQPAIINGNSELLTSLFINLIDNARKASNKGQTILFSGKISKENENRECYIFSVEDQGVGLNKEEIDKICDEFYMVDKSRARKEGGAGIGMSLVKIIAEKHNAKLVIDSKKGIGTTMKIVMEVVK
ncbi:MAG: HAMP domain-containing histidine kinase [Lachnospiraceae bacterium]|nr:HAMP domain-containing histidine kinase [Lachnospiraceae bacterium]